MELNRYLARLAALGLLLMGLGWIGRPAPLPRIEAGPAVRAPRADPPTGVPGGTAAEAGMRAAERLDLNSAGQAQLESLPGIGPALARRILEYRAAHGPFHRPEELRLVRGIGERKWAALRDMITAP